MSRSSILSQPAYYEEPRQKDISEHNRWTPGVTYLHTLGDVLRASSAPSGVGHNYVDEIPWAWVGVLPLSSCDLSLVWWSTGLTKHFLSMFSFFFLLYTKLP